MSENNNLDRMGWTGDDPITIIDPDGTEHVIGEVPQRIKKMLADRERSERADALLKRIDVAERKRKIDALVDRINDKKRKDKV